MRISNIAASFAALAVGAALVTGTTASADAHSAPAPKKVKACKGKQLKVSLKKGDAGAGTSYLAVRMRNTGKRCAIRSWPEVGYATKRGTPVGFLATHSRKWPGAVVLKHGQRRRVTLGTPAADNFPKKLCRPARARKIVAYVPGSVRPSSRHAKALKKPTKVCTTRRGRPNLTRTR